MLTNDIAAVPIILANVTRHSDPLTFARHGIPAALAFDMMDKLAQHTGPGMYTMIFHGHYRVLQLPLA